MANERTLLSYSRTALGVIAVALFIFKFASYPTDLLSGVPVLIFGVGVWLWGIYRYRKAATKLTPDEAE